MLVGKTQDQKIRKIMAIELPSSNMNKLAKKLKKNFGED